MTSYHCGKQRIGKELSKVIVDTSLDIEDEYDFKIKGYCEPFCGMLGVYQHIPELFKNHKPKLKYKAGEINESIVKMWNATKKGWEPPTTNCGKNIFYQLKKNTDKTALKGFIGHVNTMRGSYFDGYFKHKNSKIKSNSDRVINIGNILEKIM